VAANVPFWRRWLRLWGWGFLAYTVLGGLSATQNAVNAARAGQAIAWTSLIANRLLDNYGYALFVPLLYLLVRRFPLDRAHWIRSAPLLLAATFACVFVKCVWIEPAMAGLVPLAGGLDAHVFGEMYDMAGIVVVAQAIEFYRRAQERERQAVALREQLTHAQLDALRSQLHPHFLFNTLNGAATLMHTDVAAADRMLTQLSDLLRATVAYSGTHEIPLGEELELLERYLGIMRVRFRDRLTVQVDAGAEARQALVPAFLLQPLVENALRHGISAKPGPGRVDVRATRDDGRLRITVTDDGPGLAGRAGEGVGLTNTRERLAQLYGDAQELRLERSPDGGAQVLVSLPWRAAPPDAVPTP
jgi:two-component system, LytTR family, sensor kinase